MSLDYRLKLAQKIHEEENMKTAGEAAAVCSLVCSSQAFNPNSCISVKQIVFLWAFSQTTIVYVMTSQYNTTALPAVLNNSVELLKWAHLRAVKWKNVTSWNPVNPDVCCGNANDVLTWFTDLFLPLPARHLSRCVWADLWILSVVPLQADRKESHCSAQSLKAFPQCDQNPLPSSGTRSVSLSDSSVHCVSEKVFVSL